MRVLLADDEPKVRSALRLILEQLQEVESVDEATDSESLTLKLQSNPPDLLLVDWELPGLDPEASFLDLNSIIPMKVIVLSGRCCLPPKTALSAGVDAFISKCDPPDRLFATLHSMGAD